jgi:hypothetical protein|tara:strand:+ start:1067 stop:1699 length:633 start_codon:yes stop_codon:yes gene_type:complete
MPKSKKKLTDAEVEAKRDRKLDLKEGITPEGELDPQPAPKPREDDPAVEEPKAEIKPEKPKVLSAKEKKVEKAKEEKAEKTENIKKEKRDLELEHKDKGVAKREEREKVATAEVVLPKAPSVDVYDGAGRKLKKSPVSDIVYFESPPKEPEPELLLEKESTIVEWVDGHHEAKGRKYSKRIHGKDYDKMARQFAEKQGEKAGFKVNVYKK